MEFVVIKNAAEQLVSTKRKQKYPFDELEIGDGFHVPADIHSKVVSATSARAARGKGKFSVLRQPDGNYLCIRTA